jgi:hypothetical protein
MRYRPHLLTLVTSELSFKFGHDSSACVVRIYRPGRLLPKTLVDTSDELAPGYKPSLLFFAVVLGTVIEGVSPY